MEQGLGGWSFQKNTNMKTMFPGNFSKIDKNTKWNKAVQAGIFQKIDRLSSTFTI